MPSPSQGSGLPHWVWLALLVAGVYWFTHQPSEPPSPPSSPASPPAPDSGVRPGDRVPWFSFPASKSLSDPAWGPWLTDIENHLPASYGKQYRAGDHTTWAHETSHGIHSHIRNTFGKEGDNGFYVGHDKAVLISEPKVTISQVAAAVPKELRGMRYNLYLVKQAGQWNHQPLYLFDEWVAYTNGATAAVEDPGRKGTDDCVAPLEFVAYALALVDVISKHDPDYLSTNPVFKDFFAHELRRATSIYRQGMAMPRLQWDSKKLEQALLSSPLAEHVPHLYGAGFTLPLLLTRTSGSHAPRGSQRGSRFLPCSLPRSPSALLAGSSPW